MNILMVDLGVVAATIILGLGAISQAVKLYQIKTAREISIIDVALRTCCTFFFLAKFISLGSWLLIGPQIMINLIFGGYLAMVVYYKYFKFETKPL